VGDPVLVAPCYQAWPLLAVYGTAAATGRAGIGQDRGYAEVEHGCGGGDHVPGPGAGVGGEREGQPGLAAVR
jgi:hypothetical protein